MSWRVVDSSTLPSDTDGLTEVLCRAWEGIDAWIADQRDAAGASS